MIDADFVGKIAELAGVASLTVDGKTFTDKTVTQVELKQYLFPTVKLVSLDSLVEYVEANKEVTDELRKYAFIICSDFEAKLIGMPEGEQRLRDVIASVNACSVFGSLAVWMDQESFRIWMMTQFKETKDQRDLLTLLIKITDENVQISEDNGVSQVVTARVAVAAVGAVQIPSPIRLKPIRTFEEIDQPEGMFVFRLRKGAKGGFEMALFETATNWKRTAAMSVAAYLKEKLPEMTVLA
jgi:hypothetical protein